jgi:single-strand DNA-binding protein
MNTVSLVGRLTAPPELKYTPSGICVCSFTLAVKDPFKKLDGGGYAVDYIDCTAWRASAEFLANYTDKGREVGVTGRLKQQSWTTQDGQKRKRVIVQAEEVEAYGSSGQRERVQGSAPDGQEAPPPSDGGW